MTTHPFLNPRGMEGIQQTWLKDRIAEFLMTFVTQGFKHRSLLTYAQHLCAFGTFAERRGVREPTQLADRIESFVRPIRPPKEQRRRRNFLTRFTHFVSPRTPAPGERPVATTHPQARLIDEYAMFLREHRGLRPNTISKICSTCATFLTFLVGDGCSDLAALRPDGVHRFIVARAKRCSRVGLRHCCSLRGFLAYLHRRGVLGTDLVPAVILPREYKHERCPRFLTRTEVEAVLAAVDRRTPGGKRSYAMLLLLATYGLRGVEVQSLRLDAIDWRSDRIHIANRKAGNSTDYPLTPAVGEAVLDYLKNGRPVTTHREVFVTAIAPIKPMTSSNPIADQVRKYLNRAKIAIARPGTHSFRYSCAQRLLDGGTSLKVIGDYLGHTHPDSTERYVKIAINQLREVALGDVEELP